MRNYFKVNPMDNSIIYNPRDQQMWDYIKDQTEDQVMDHVWAQMADQIDHIENEIWIQIKDKL